MRFLFLSFTLCIAAAASAQIRLGVFGGIANYQGDLVAKPFASPRAAVGVSATLPVTEKFSLRAGLTFARIAGADSLNSSAAFRSRNLSFQSPITELSLLGEYNLFNLDNRRWTPYVFAGIAGFGYNPFTYEGRRKVYLKPLSTEGQGIAGYNREHYALTGFAIPFGGGVKFALGDNVNLGLEAGLRKTFTDYLDDVSTTYADAGDLLKARNQQAVNLAFRGDELPGSTQTYPARGEPRGSAKSKDYYYFTGLHLTFNLGSGGGLFRSRGKRSYGCPQVAM